jgi:tetratricopeptide (TPR) repeat protein
MTNFPKTTAKFLIALLKHQAKQWLGEDAAGIAAQTVISEDLQKQLDGWLKQAETTRQLLNAAKRAQDYLQDPRNCPNSDLHGLFRDLPFGDESSVQAALADLPGAMDSNSVQLALREAFVRDLPNLSPEQQEEAARLYTDALLRAVGTLEPFLSPILLQTALDLKKGQFAQDKKLDEIISLLQARVNAAPVAPSPTLPGDLPPGSYLPFWRNKFFTGRVEDLQTLAETLQADHLAGAVVNQALSGMGGVGKTQLAVEFAYEYGHRFKGVHWLDLRDPQALDSQIALCGEKMGLPNWPPTQPEQVSATLRAWCENHPRLLILDNFEDLAFANPVLARLRHSGLRLLLTSRHRDWPPALGLTRLALEEFSPDESLAFLRNYLPEQRAEDAALQKLAEHLGHLPLALELAGRYLDRLPRLGIDNYLAALEKALDHPSMQNWKPELGSLTGHDLSLAQTFAQSWEQLGALLARQVFIKAGYCAPNTPLPVPVLEAMLAEDAETLALDEALADLLALGLLKEGPAIHPLLAQFARGLDEEQAMIAEFSVEFSKRAIQTNHITDQTGDYSLYAPLLPHVHAVAEKAEAAGLEKAGALWNSLGYHIKALADYAGAQAAYERAIKIWEANLGSDHPQVATGVSNLGSVLRDLGDLAGAQAAFERALKIDEAVYGPDHPSVAIRVNNLGDVFRDLGDLAGAQAAFERALKIDEAVYGPDHPSVATLVSNLGNALRGLGDLAGAQAAFERALKIDETAYGPDHPSVGRDVNNLGAHPFNT